MHTYSGDVGSVAWKAVMSGAADEGAAGLPGPFQQSISEICAALRKAAEAKVLAPNDGDPLLSSHADSTGHLESKAASEIPLLRPCPNNLSQSGDDREKLIVNPAFTRPQDLAKCWYFGQLIAVAIRSKCCLNLDLTKQFWEQILGRETIDLKSLDFLVWQNLQVPPYNNTTQQNNSSNLALTFSAVPSISMVVCSSHSDPANDN